MNIRENIYNRKDGWLKTRRIITGYNKVTIYDGKFQREDIYIMAVDEVSCRVIGIGQEFRNMGRWSWMLLRGRYNMRTIIITAYCPTASASAGRSYIQQLEPLAIMIIQNEPRTKCWIDLSKEISKWIHQGEQLFLMEDWNSEASK